VEQSEDVPQKLDQRNVRPRLEGHSQGAPGNEPTDEAMPVINPQGSSLGGQHCEGNSSDSLPVALPPHLPGNAGPNVNSLDVPHQAIVPPKADEEPAPTLMDVNPESGSVTGGARIWLKGKDFSVTFPLFARFGTAVVATVSTIKYLSSPIQSCFSDFLLCNPSFLSFAFCNHARPRRRYTLKGSPAKCGRVRDQYRKVPVLKRPRSTVSLSHVHQV